jgi:peptidoglycan pentaglycine glycine transferase (the first glycine)
MTAREIIPNEKEKYNDFIVSSKNGHIFQSYEWGEIKRGDGWQPIRLIVEDNGRIKAAVCVLKKEIFGYSIFYAPRGPAVDYGDSETLSFLINEIKKLASIHKAVFLQINPDIPQDDEFAKRILKERGFLSIEKHGLFRLTQPKYVFRLSLRANQDEIYGRFSSSTRKNINIAERKGVSVECRDDVEGLKIFYGLLKETGRRKNFLIRPFDYQYRIYKEMVSAGSAKVFLAKYNGEYIGSRLVFIFGNKCWDMYAGSSVKYPEARANYSLVWHIIKWAKEKGCVWFDFRGAGAWNIKEHPERGIYEFKSRFGPDLCGFIGDYYLVFLPRLYFLYEKGEAFPEKILRNFLKLRKAIKIMGSKEDKGKKYSNSVLEKYGREEEIKEYSLSISGIGLGYEEKIISKHFTAPGRILDIGCGAGREAISLSKKGFEVVGIDFQPKMVEEAKRNAEAMNVKIEFSVMDACKMDFPQDSFDYILMVGSLVCWIPYRKNRITVLEEVWRILKPGGKLIMSAPSKNRSFKHKLYFFVMDSWRRFLRSSGIPSLEPGDRFTYKVSGNRKISGGKAFLHMYSMKEAIEDIEGAGLTMVECRSREEIIKDTDMPLKREKDYFIYYAAKK